MRPLSKRLAPCNQCDLRSHKRSYIHTFVRVAVHPAWPMFRDGRCSRLLYPRFVAIKPPDKQGEFIRSGSYSVAGLAARLHCMPGDFHRHRHCGDRAIFQERFGQVLADRRQNHFGRRHTGKSRAGLHPYGRSKSNDSAAIQPEDCGLTRLMWDGTSPSWFEAGFIQGQAKCVEWLPGMDSNHE